MKRYFLSENDIVNLLGMIVEDVMIYGPHGNPIKQVPEQPIPGSQTPPPMPQQSYGPPPMPQQSYGPPPMPQQSTPPPMNPQAGQMSPTSTPETSRTYSFDPEANFWDKTKNTVRQIGQEMGEIAQDEHDANIKRWAKWGHWLKKKIKWILLIIAAGLLIYLVYECSGDNMKTPATADSAGDQNIDTTKYNTNSIKRVTGPKKK